MNETFKLLESSSNKIDDDLRGVNRELSELKISMLKFKQQKKELSLENEMTLMDLNKIIKQKEESLVRHDIMKLEIKKIADVVNEEIDTVFEMENTKY